MAGIQVTIRNAQLEDASEINEIERICFADPWSTDAIEYEIKENPIAMYIVGEADGRVVGYVGIHLILDEGHITNVAVHPEYRRMGLAESIIEVMLNHTLEHGINHHTLEVRASNEAAQKLYEKFGFKTEGVRKGYYRDNKEDALIMWRHEE